MTINSNFWVDFNCKITIPPQTKAVVSSNTNTPDDNDEHWEQLTMLLQQELELKTIENNRYESLQRSLEEELRGLRKEVQVAEQIYQGEVHDLIEHYWTFSTTMWYPNPNNLPPPTPT